MFFEDVHLALKRKIHASFVPGGRVMLEDLCEEVQLGIILMKKVLAADPALRQAALEGAGWRGIYGPLSKIYERKSNVPAMSIWSDLHEEERSTFVADGWTESSYEAFMAFADLASDLARSLGQAQPLRLLCHFIKCDKAGCECCEPSPFVLKSHPETQNRPL